MPSSASEWPVASPPISVGEVEVVAGVHAHARRQPAAQRDLLAGVEQRDLDAVDLRRVRRDDRGADVRRARVVGIAREAAGADPVAGERGIEHVAQPVQDHRLAHLRQHAAVDLRVVVRRPRARRERAARHQDDAAARGFDRPRTALRTRRSRRRSSSLAAGARWSVPAPENTIGARRRARLRNAAADQLERRRPVEAHAALRGVHRFGDAEAERPQVAAKRERRVPVDRGGEPRIDVGARIGDDVRRGERDAVPRGVRGGQRPRRAARAACTARARRRRRKAERGHAAPAHPRCALPLPACRERVRCSGGTSTQRRSLPALRCRARRAARPSRLRAGSSGTGSPVTTWRRNSSHSTLNALSYARFAGSVLPRREEIDRLRHVGIPHGLRRGGARLDPAVGEAGDRGAERAVDVERHEIVAAHARAPRAVDLRDDAAAVELERRVGGVVGRGADTACPLVPALAGCASRRGSSPP